MNWSSTGRTTRGQWTGITREGGAIQTRISGGTFSGGRARFSVPPQASACGEPARRAEARRSTLKRAPRGTSRPFTYTQMYISGPCRDPGSRQVAGRTVLPRDGDLVETHLRLSPRAQRHVAAPFHQFARFGQPLRRKHAGLQFSAKLPGVLFPQRQRFRELPAGDGLPDGIGPWVTWHTFGWPYPSRRTCWRFPRTAAGSRRSSHRPRPSGWSGWFGVEPLDSV